jgi:hypothetical protein
VRNPQDGAIAFRREVYDGLQAASNVIRFVHVARYRRHNGIYYEQRYSTDPRYSFVQTVHVSRSVE